MVQYRGVEQTEIADSIESAIAFLKALDIGDECNELLEKASNPKDIARIRNAKNPDQLVYAMHESDADYAFTMLYLALRYHALADTDNQGHSIYQNLAKWGGGQSARDMGGSLADFEIDQHLSALPHLDIFQEIPNVELPFDRYGIAFADQTPKPYREQRSDNADLISAITEALEPFDERDEVEMLGIGVVGSWEGKQSGFSFDCTRNAAQAIADQFPEYNVINSKDEVIAPQVKSHVAEQEARRAAGGERAR